MQNRKFVIDLVYLWVDGSDEEWLEKKQHYSNNDYTTEATDISRTKDNDELKFSLRSVDKYLPWINKIFIVTDKQIPEWLDTSNPKINVVFHQDFIPKDILPTFNSTVIELYLHKIPGLEEHFLYANDDMFINCPLNQDFFFTADGKPIVRLQKSTCIKKAHKSAYSYTIIQMQKLIKERFGKYYNLEPHHNIDAYTKTLFKECECEFESTYKNCPHNRFRSNDDIQRSLVSFYALATNKAVLKVVPRTDFYLPAGTKFFNKLTHKYEADSKYIGLDKKLLKERFEYVNPRLFCINDNENANEGNRLYAKNFLKELYPYSSSFENKKDIIISIIVPVYNVEDYLYKCLTSLINQTFKNIEIICINDGSTDNSLNILEEYKNKDNRIKIINQNNKGVSEARNCGIQKAKGDYILFVDADDCLEPDACEIICNQISKENSDVLIFSHYDIFPNKRKPFNLSKFCKKRILKYNDINDYINNIIYLPTVVWGKLYKRDFIIKKDLKFNNSLRQSEDTLFWMEVLYNKPQISILNKHLYNYLNIRKGSVLNSIEASLENFHISHKLLKESNLFLHCNSQSQMKLIDRDLNYFCWMWKKHKNKRTDIVREINMFMKEYSDYGIRNNHLKNFKKLKKYLNQYKFQKIYNIAGQIFSINNDEKMENKILTILGVKYSFKRNVG